MMQFRENLLLKFSVVSFGIILILAVSLMTVITWNLNENIALLHAHGQAMINSSLEPSDPFSIPNIQRNVVNLQWISLGIIAGSFIILYLSLVSIVSRGWQTITRQQNQLSMANDELSKANSSLQSSELKYRTLIERMNEGLMYCDLEDEIQFVNGRFCDLVGYTREELLGQKASRLLLSAEAQQLMAGKRTLREQGISDQYELPLRKKSGETVWVQVSGTPYVDSDGAIIGALGIHTDITRSKQTEEALRQAQKIESLGVLAGGVAHDFNNLLVAMLGQTSLALVTLPRGHPARTHIAKAVTAAERAADLTRQMLAYSGRGHFETRPVNFNRLIQDNLHLFEVAIPKNVHLQSDLADPLPLIHADAGQMQQVIMNLILNAAEAIGQRHGTVTVTTGRQQLTAEDDYFWQYTGESLAPGHYISVEVHDNGQGIDAETLSRMFDPFFTTKHTGRGLGLAAVLGIVRGHKGGLRVYSELGSGTTFKLLFPVAAEQAEGLERPSNHPQASMHPATVLVIDDEASVREAVKDILEMEGLQVIAADDGAMGVQQYRDRAGEIELILLDLSMPNLGGEETFRQLRQINPDVRVILSSGYNQVEATRRFAGKGITGFLQKPYNATTLTQTIRRHLGQVPGDH